MCSFEVSSQTNLDNTKTQTAVRKAVESLAAGVEVKFNNGTNDVAAIFHGLDANTDAKIFCDMVATKLVGELPSSLFDGAVIQDIYLGSSVRPRSCTYNGSCGWFWSGCTNYKSCTRVALVLL